MSRKNDIKRLIAKHNRHLQKLKEREASFGSLHIPVHILTEIEDIEAEIEKLQTELELLDKKNVEPKSPDDVTKDGLSWLWIASGSAILVTIMSVIAFLTWYGGSGNADIDVTPTTMEVVTTTQQVNAKITQTTDTPTATSTLVPTPTPTPIPTQTPTSTLTSAPPTPTFTLEPTREADNVVIVASTAVATESVKPTLTTTQVAETEQEIPSIDFVSHIGGVTLAVDIVGNTAYVGVGPRLVVLDISDPTQPVFLGQTDPLRDIVMGIKIVGTYAYAILGNYANTAGYDFDSQLLSVIDISNPTSPTQVGFLSVSGNPIAITSSNHYVFVVTNKDTYYSDSSYLNIIDISDPTSPTQVGSYYKGGANFRGVAVMGNHAYVVDRSSGFGIIDISNPVAPTEVGFYKTAGAQGVTVLGNYMYVTSRDLKIIDISDPAFPTNMGSYPMSSFNVSGVTIFGSYAYVAAGGSGLRIIDISNPNSPTE